METANRLRQEQHDSEGRAQDLQVRLASAITDSQPTQHDRRGVKCDEAVLDSDTLLVPCTQDLIRNANAAADESRAKLGELQARVRVRVVRVRADEPSSSPHAQGLWRCVAVLASCSHFRATRPLLQGTIRQRNLLKQQLQTLHLEQQQVFSVTS